MKRNLHSIYSKSCVAQRVVMKVVAVATAAAAAAAVVFVLTKGRIMITSIMIINGEILI